MVYSEPELLYDIKQAGIAVENKTFYVIVVFYEKNVLAVLLILAYYKFRTFVNFLYFKIIHYNIFTNINY